MIKKVSYIALLLFVLYTQANCQSVYNPSLHLTVGKPFGAYGNNSIDARSEYYVDTSYTYRPYVDTSEVNHYLQPDMIREGMFKIFVSSGDSTLIWWYRNGTADSDLTRYDPSGDLHYLKSQADLLFLPYSDTSSMLSPYTKKGSNISQFSNDVGYYKPADTVSTLGTKYYINSQGFLKSYTETDPIWNAAINANTTITGNWTFNNGIVFPNANIGYIKSTSGFNVLGVSNTNGDIFLGYNVSIDSSNNISQPIPSQSSTIMDFNSTGSVYIKSAPPNSPAAPYGTFFTKAESAITPAGFSSSGALSVNSGGITTFGDASQNELLFQSLGVAPPSFTTRSQGTKIVLYPNMGSTTTDYAIGIDNSTIWQSLPAFANSFYFKWYGGTTNIATLDGIGDLSLSGTATSTKFITSGGTSSQFVKGDGSLDGAAYAPLTGTGASGTWGISITGNAATATNSNELGGLTSSGFIINNTVQQASSNFNISGNGTVGGYLESNGGSLIYNSGMYVFQTWEQTNNSSWTLRVANADSIFRLIRNNSNGIPTDLYDWNFNGNYSNSGTITASGFYNSSDTTLKNIYKWLPSKDSIQPIYFSWKSDPLKLKHWGYAAQQVAKVLPDAVIKGEDGKLKVDYNEVQTYKIAQLEKDNKKLSNKVDKLQNEVNRLMLYIKSKK